MATLPEMQRKIRQLDHDVQAIYEMLAGITATQGRHGNRLDEMDLKLDGLDSKLEGVDSKLDGLESKLEETDSKLEETDRKLDTIITMLGERRS